MAIMVNGGQQEVKSETISQWEQQFLCFLQKGKSFSLAQTLKSTSYTQLIVCLVLVQCSDRAVRGLCSLSLDVLQRETAQIFGVWERIKIQPSHKQGSRPLTTLTTAKSANKIRFLTCNSSRTVFKVKEWDIKSMMWLDMSVQRTFMGQV